MTLGFNRAIILLCLCKRQLAIESWLTCSLVPRLLFTWKCNLGMRLRLIGVELNLIMRLRKQDKECTQAMIVCYDSFVSCWSLDVYCSSPWLLLHFRCALRMRMRGHTCDPRLILNPDVFQFGQDLLLCRRLSHNSKENKMNCTVQIMIHACRIRKPGHAWLHVRALAPCLIWPRTRSMFPWKCARDGDEFS